MCRSANTAKLAKLKQPNKQRSVRNTKVIKVKLCDRLVHAKKKEQSFISDIEMLHIYLQCVVCFRKSTSCDFGLLIRFPIFKTFEFNDSSTWFHKVPVLPRVSQSSLIHVTYHYINCWIKRIFNQLARNGLLSPSNSIC